MIMLMKEQEEVGRKKKHYPPAMEAALIGQFGGND